MNKLLTRVAAIAAACLIAVPSIAAATEISVAQRDAIATGGEAFFRAVVDGNAKAVIGLTTPSFTLTTLEGQTLSAQDLAAKWRILMIEYGGVHGSTKLESASTDGKTITAVYSVAAYADRASGLGQELPATSALHAVHKVVWVPRGSAWKIASDIVVRQTANFPESPSL